MLMFICLMHMLMLIFIYLISMLMLIFICLISISSQKQTAVRNNRSSVIYLQVEMGSLAHKLPVN